jgi:myo-inositol-1(or 4)-monophosphatase
LLDFALDAAQQAGDLALEHFHSDAGYELKADNTPVTIADRGAEELLRKRIERAYPAHTAPEAVATNGHLFEQVIREIRR